MGMYDEVTVKCPECGFKVDFQSKAGRCNLDVYYADEVPAIIAKDLDGEVEVCTHCKGLIKLNYSEPIPTVQMKITMEIENE